MGTTLILQLRREYIRASSLANSIAKLIMRFHKICNRYPKRLLLMRDGLVQEGEFKQTIKALQEKNIAVDLVSVRKSLNFAEWGVKSI